MLVKSQEAQSLCTGAEYQLFVDSLEPLIRQFGAGRIRRCIRRANRLAALWRARADSDRLEPGRSTRKLERNSRASHVLARRKEEMFSQVASRLGARLDALDEIGRLGHGVRTRQMFVEGTDC